MDVEDDCNEEETGNVNLDDGKGRQWRIVFKDNYGGMDDKKGLLHAKR